MARAAAAACSRSGAGQRLIASRLLRGLEALDIDVRSEADDAHAGASLGANQTNHLDGVARLSFEIDEDQLGRLVPHRAGNSVAPARK